MPQLVSPPVHAVAKDTQEFDELRRRLHWAELKIQKLEERLRLARMLNYVTRQS